MAQKHSSRMTGVTMIELLIVITIVAILMGIGVPSYRYITTSYRISGEINGLLGDVQFARAEAVKEGQNVTVCVSTDGASCAASTGWQAGWIVFSDPTSAKTTNGHPELVLRRQVAFTGGDTFDNGATGALIFNREGLVAGLLTSGGALIPLHEPTANVNWTRCLQLSNVGAAFVVQHTSVGSCT
jgi:type IV fimbrial biogenesis protein FimT